MTNVHDQNQETPRSLTEEAVPTYLRNAQSHIVNGDHIQADLFAPLNKTIFEKLGRPERFRHPVRIIPGTIQHELSTLRKLMLDNRIQLLVSSPNISDGDLFRFLTGEFMDIRITDDGSPLFHCFLYDDYHPDPFFDNEQTALNRCIRLLLDRTLPFPPEILMEQVHLNHYGPLTKRDAVRVIENFKSQYQEIVVLEITAGNTTILDTCCEVTGSHTTGFIRGNKSLLRTGRWTVRFGLNDAAEWKINELRIEDVDI